MTAWVNPRLTLVSNVSIDRSVCLSIYKYLNRYTYYTSIYQRINLYTHTHTHTHIYIYKYKPRSRDSERRNRCSAAKPQRCLNRGKQAVIQWYIYLIYICISVYLPVYLSIYQYLNRYIYYISIYQSIHLYTLTYTYTHTHGYIYIYIYIYTSLVRKIRSGAADVPQPDARGA